MNIAKIPLWMESRRAACNNEALAESSSAIQIESFVTALNGMDSKTRSYFRTVPYGKAAVAIVFGEISARDPNLRMESIEGGFDFGRRR